MSDSSGFDDFYIGDSGWGALLLSIDDRFGEKFLEMKSVAVLPSCKGFPGKLTGWFAKSNYFLESNNKDVFASGFVQLKSCIGGFRRIGLYSELCEEIFSTDKWGNQLEVMLLEKRFSCSYFLTQDSKIFAAVFDDDLNCMLHLGPCETVPGMMQSRPRICASKHLTGMEMTRLSIVALVSEIHGRNKPDGD